MLTLRATCAPAARAAIVGSLAMLAAVMSACTESDATSIAPTQSEGPGAVASSGTFSNRTSNEDMTARRAPAALDATPENSLQRPLMDPRSTATLDLTTSTPSRPADPTARMPLFGAYGHRNTPALNLETPTPDPFETDDVGWP